MITASFSGARPVHRLAELESILRLGRSTLQRIADELDGDDERHYKRFVGHSGGGKLRDLAAPRSEIRRVQVRIRQRLLRRVDLPSSMFGGVRGKSPSMNAAQHTGRASVLTMDIRDCFPCTTAASVARMFGTGLGCAASVKRLLTRLVTLDGGVPQGALTSMDVVNLCLYDMVRELEAVAERYGLQFSIWVDDMAFSGDRVEDVIDEVFAVARKYGYRLGRNKVQLMRCGSPQVVTGLLVSARRPTVPRAKRDDLERKIGEVALRGSYSVKDEQRILGSIRWMRSVAERQAGHLERYWGRVSSHCALAS